jgi:hypothetical protein
MLTEYEREIMQKADWFDPHTWGHEDEDGTRHW